MFHRPAGSGSGPSLLRARRHRRVLLSCAALLLIQPGCVSPPPASEAAEPDWVKNGGKSPRFSDSCFVTGFAMAEDQNAVEVAKQQASADLASKISVRIQHELQDVVEEKDGEYRYRIAAITHSTTDIQLTGLLFETHERGRRAYVLAYLDRQVAAEQRERERNLSLIDLRECVSSAERHERARRATDAIHTYKGRRGVVYTEREKMKIYLRVNQPAWVRLVYVLQNGAQVPLEQAYYIDASKVNFVVEYPEAFEVVPPFGVEHIHATGFTMHPEPLATRRVMINGESYNIVADGMDAVVRTRGLRRVRNDEKFAMAEGLMTVTTTPRSPGER